jgi:copper chaperone NosL
VAFAQRQKQGGRWPPLVFIDVVFSINYKLFARRINMQKNLAVLLAALSLTLTLSGGAVLAEQKPGHMEGRQHAAGNTTESAHADVNKHQACAHCGMDRGIFAHSRMLITYSDGSSVGVCSIHCAATELKSGKSKTLKSVYVADLNTKKLVDAEKAVWVIGGSKKGVMTKTAKWAFAKKDDATGFVKNTGGKPCSYKDALALAEKD